MIVLRPTRKAQKRLNVTLEDKPAASTSKLGDWYVNIVDTRAGELFVLVSDATLLAVALPTREQPFFALFVSRVANLLAMIDIPYRLIESELQHFTEVVFAKADSRRVQGSANDIAYRLQVIAEDKARPGKPLSLSQAELFLAEMPHSPLGFNLPREIAAQLLSATGRIA